jgi:Swiss Army Knife RNA repair-like protein
MARGVLQAAATLRQVTVCRKHNRRVATKPLLFVEVDGVLNPYPACPAGFHEHALFPEDDEPVRLAPIHGGWLRELSERFDLVWASAWAEDANRLLSPYFGLDELPVVPLPRAPFSPTAKLRAIEAFAVDRLAAWIDDIVTPEAKRWADRRRAPTLVIEVEPSAGLTRPTVDHLLAWAVALQASSSGNRATWPQAP